MMGAPSIPPPSLLPASFSLKGPTCLPLSFMAEWNQLCGHWVGDAGASFSRLQITRSELGSSPSQNSTERTDCKGVSDHACPLSPVSGNNNSLSVPLSVQDSCWSHGCPCWLSLGRQCSSVHLGCCCTWSAGGATADFPWEVPDFLTFYWFSKVWMPLCPDAAPQQVWCWSQGKGSSRAPFGEEWSRPECDLYFMSFRPLVPLW